MSLTKRQLIERALNELVLGDYIFDFQPEQLEANLYQLEDLMAELAGTLGVGLGYNLKERPNLDDESGIPNWANKAIYLNLAIAIGRSLGKSIDQTLMGEAQKSMGRVMSLLSTPPKKKYESTLPVGSGNKWANPYWKVYYGKPDFGLQLGPQGSLDLV